VAWKEVRKQGNVEHMVVPYVALWNIGFQWMQIVLLNLFAHKESSTCEICSLICEVGYVDPCHLHQNMRLWHYTRNRCKFEAVHFSCWCMCGAFSEHIELLVLISRPIFDGWSLTRSRTQLSYHSVEQHKSNIEWSCLTAGS
jgi:hypothetical protein